MTARQIFLTRRNTSSPIARQSFERFQVRLRRLGTCGEAKKSPGEKPGLCD